MYDLDDFIPTLAISGLLAVIVVVVLVAVSLFETWKFNSLTGCHLTPLESFGVDIDNFDTQTCEYTNRPITIRGNN